MEKKELWVSVQIHTHTHTQNKQQKGWVNGEEKVTQTQSLQLEFVI